MTSPPPLHGLVLAGGASRRMQTDKAALEYRGQSQLQRAFALLEKFCAQTFVSVRADQVNDPLRGKFPTIADRQEGLGPIAGIAAAQTAHPDVAWLVLACDLPFLEAATLEYLIRHRAPARAATAFRSTHDGLPEPLCAIWEPASGPSVAAWIAAGKQCPRKLLINSDVLLLDQPEMRALDNVNTPDEFAAANRTLGTGHWALARGGYSDQLPPEPRVQSPELPLKTLRIQYFALFREQAGRSEELLESTAETPAMLYRELQARHPFRLQKEQLRVAVNTEFCDWQARLNSGDTVVFIPPVAGG